MFTDQDSKESESWRIISKPRTELGLLGTLRKEQEHCYVRGSEPDLERSVAQWGKVWTVLVTNVIEGRRKDSGTVLKKAVSYHSSKHYRTLFSWDILSASHSPEVKEISSWSLSLLDKSCCDMEIFATNDFASWIEILRCILSKFSVYIRWASCRHRQGYTVYSPVVV